MADIDRDRLDSHPAIALGTVGLALCAVSFVVALTGSTPDHVGLAVRQALIVGVPIAVGLYAWRTRPHERFGRGLVAVGFACFLATLSASDDSLLYSVGRVFGWLVELGLIYLILAFPTGRLNERVDRALMGAAVVLVAVVFLPTALLTEGYPLPSWLADCTGDCPGNAFMVLGAEPALVEDVVRPLRELLTIALFLAVTARLAHRMLHATRLMRRTVSPVLAVAMVRVLALAAAIAVRRVDGDSVTVEVLFWLLGLGIPAMAIGFLAGMVRWRVFAATALQRLAAGMTRHPDREQLRNLIAHTLDDPTIRIVYWAQAGEGRWVDVMGRPAALPRGDPARCVTEIRDGGRRVAAIVYDAALRDEREFVEAVGAFALMALENHDLTARVEATLQQVQESRARILAAADDERRRIERDLHDGAQQRLVAMRIRLELIEELTRADPERGRAMLHALGPEVTATLEEVKALAAGVYPSLLEDRGLIEALRSAALRSPVSARVDANGNGRYSRDVETAVYFCCLEAMQNAAKHATGATSVSIVLRSDGALRFEVRDDGVGFVMDRRSGGHGLTSMHDRIAAVGGRLEVVSAPGAGTTVRGSIPAG